MSDKNPPVVDYILEAKMHVVNFFNNNSEKTDTYVLSVDKVYVVWFSKVLQNWKAMVSTDVPDGMYYEITHNGDKGETYIDAYKKHKNECIVEPMPADLFDARVVDDETPQVRYGRTKNSDKRLALLVYTGEYPLQVSEFIGQQEVDFDPYSGRITWTRTPGSFDRNEVVPGMYLIKRPGGYVSPATTTWVDEHIMFEA